MSSASDFELLFRYEYSRHPRLPPSPPSGVLKHRRADGIYDRLHRADEERTTVRTACVNSAIKKNECSEDHKKTLSRQRSWRCRAHKRIVKLSHQLADAGSDVFLIVIPRNSRNRVLGCISDRFRSPAVDEEEVYRTTRLLQAQNGSVATPTSLPPTGARRREQRAREKFTEYNLHRKDKYRHKIRGLISEDDDEEMMDDEDGT